jgi:hypothetical protein
MDILKTAEDGLKGSTEKGPMVMLEDGYVGLKTVAGG